MEDYLDEAYQPLIVVLKNESKENFRESNKADSLFMKICCAVAKMRHFSLMMEVFAMYEEGRTRSQNLKPAELRGLKRPEIPFRKLGLDPRRTEEVLHYTSFDEHG
ncbi:uncharacterized protein [Ptychodera flava]|uniref:uncharacterized protein n=1 Tax=Ptychodera flava TaxID=63121 RepID=UPI003969FC37